jgi:ppGpp synthetase/RelA/SpoT-type nucleotidyltranferase
MGKRLASGTAGPDDQALYEQTLDVYDRVQVTVKEALATAEWPSPLGEVSVSGRTKSLDTLIQKLQRTPGLQLPYVNDIAGVRVVGDFTLTAQRAFVEGVTRAFGASDGDIIDRIRNPQSGYRALHVVVSVSDIRVEIQVRTRLQSLWADVFERLADSWGRQIRYGDPPDDDPSGEVDRAEMVEWLKAMSLDVIAEIEQIEDQMALLRAARAQGLVQPTLRQLDLTSLGIPTDVSIEDMDAALASREARSLQAKRELEEQLLRLGEWTRRSGSTDDQHA